MWGKGIKQKTKTNKLNSAVPHKEGHQVVLIKKRARYTKLIFFLTTFSTSLRDASTSFIVKSRDGSLVTDSG